jgi:hypothetical protein
VGDGKEATYCLILRWALRVARVCSRDCNTIHFTNHQYVLSESFVS